MRKHTLEAVSISGLVYPFEWIEKHAQLKRTPTGYVLRCQQFGHVNERAVTLRRTSEATLQRWGVAKRATRAKPKYTRAELLDKYGRTGEFSFADLGELYGIPRGMEPTETPAPGATGETICRVVKM